MADELWTMDDLLAAVPFASADGRPDRAITGFSIDTRSLKPGDVFIALKDQRDAHEFVTNAFREGASLAIVNDTYERRPGDGALMRCKLDALRKEFPDYHEKRPDCDALWALQKIGAAARNRLAPGARVVAVTGSAGKTGTKEMLRGCMLRVGTVHASEKSYNNHWGVPLSLARMPADTEFAVFEIGMNHAGEITPLTEMVRPHVAIITTVEAVHLEHFRGVEEIADAKAEIFRGLVSGGAAIVKRDSPHFDRQRVRAEIEAARVVSFGLTNTADVFAETLNLGEDGTDITVRIGGKRVSYRLAMPGRHIAENSLAVVAALDAIGADLDIALTALADLAPPPGRGARTVFAVPGGEVLLIDESYNANPASMRAALGTLGTVSRAKFPRRIAVLGDMLELGPDAPALHCSLKDAVDEAGVDVIFACGPDMRNLYDAVPEGIRGGYDKAAAQLSDKVLGALRAGDVVMVKASNGTRLGQLVDALKAKFGKDLAAG